MPLPLPEEDWADWGDERSVDDSLTRVSASPERGGRGSSSEREHERSHGGGDTHAAASEIEIGHVDPSVSASDLPASHGNQPQIAPDQQEKQEALVDDAMTRAPAAGPSSGRILLPSPDTEAESKPDLAHDLAPKLPVAHDAELAPELVTVRQVTVTTNIEPELAVSLPPTLAVKVEPAAEIVEGETRTAAEAENTAGAEVKPTPITAEAENSGRATDTPLREIGVDTPEPDPKDDDRQCRICLGGVEDELEMGRLISPCLCAGSMRFVHINCINEWRGSGANAKSFMECPQCGYEYHFRRTAVVGLAKSRPLLMLLTTLIFFSLTLLAGHLLFKYLVALVESELQQAEEAVKTGKGSGKKKTVYYDDDDDYFWETNIVLLGGTTLIYDIVTEAVHTFVILAGDAYDYFAADGGRVSSFCVAILVRLILGLSILGSLSGLTLLASLSLFAPLQVVYALRGTGIFDGLRRRINSRNGTVLIVAFVLVGILNSIVQVYDLVQSITSRALRYVETQIVEVHSPEARAGGRHAHPPGWWERWWAERRWRTAAGWKEVRLRAWLATKEWARQWKAQVAAAARGEVAG